MAHLVKTVSVAVLFLLLTAYSFRTEAAAPEADAGSRPYRIQADRITYNPVEKAYTAEGDVVVTHLESRLRADRVQVNTDDMVVRASGGVFFTTGEDTLEGDRLIMNLAEQTGTLYSGRIFIEESNFHIKGERIMKTGKDTYAINGACLTTCDPENPDWSITSAHVNVTIDGYGTLRHGAFRVRNIPVFYTPYLFFPAKTKRQSGLLFPHLEYSSRNGIIFIQPYFWAISDHMDATFYYHHIQQRGEKAGIEYRYMAGEASKGTVMLDGFKDRRVDDDPDDPDRKWGYTDDRFLRPNSDRYWFRMKADQALPADFSARLDLDVVSDQDYLRDFRGGYTGHGHTENVFQSEFDRGIDDRNDRVRENRLNLNRTWPTASLNADAVWHDDVVARRQMDTNPTLQRLPMISYSMLKQPVFHNRLYGAMNTEYAYFFREDGVTGHRADLHPRIFFPLYPAGRFMLEPYAGYRQTVWYTDAARDDIAADNRLDPDLQRYTQRGIYDLGADLTTDFHRVFPVSAFGIEKVRHGVLPRIRYSYIPDVRQSEYPDFDEIDRIDEENQVSFSMTHFFTSRLTVTRPGADPEASYNMFARFMVEQPYDFNHEESADAFLPLYAELDITPARLFALHADARYSHQKDAFTRSNTSLRFRDMLGSRFRVDYRYTRDASKTLKLGLEVPVREWLTIYGDFERSLIDHTTVESGIGFLYQTDCWSADFSYRALEDLDGSRDERYYLLIRLFGIGEFGN